MSAKAQKLLERMRNSHANWKRRDIDALYAGFGFRISHGSNHDHVSHPEYPDLRDTLPRHRKVPIYIVRNAIRIVDKLIELRDTADNSDRK